MAENIRCVECGEVVFGLVLDERAPTPVGRDACPHCGATSFTTLDAGDGSDGIG